MEDHWGIPCAGIDTRLPLNILDSNLTALSVKFPEEEDQPTIYTSVRLQSLFHLLTNSIYERIITDPFPSARLLLDWDQIYLERWKKLLPDYFKSGAAVSRKFKLAHFVLEWRYRNLKIIMFRTFLLKKVILDPKTLDEGREGREDSYESRAADLCLKECSETINSMVKFWDKNTRNNRMEVWYSLYFLIPAVLMPLVCLRNDPTSTFAEYWRSDIISAQGIIQKLISIGPAASKILDLISNLGNNHLLSQANETGDDNPSHSSLGTDESPLAQFNQLHEMLWPMSFDIDQQFLQQ